MKFSTWHKKIHDSTQHDARKHTLLALSLPVILLSSAASAQVNGDNGETPFADASLYFELNNTDGDLGIHALIDGEPWRRLTISDMNENRILVVRNRGRLGRQGMTELFFESAEPPFDELAPEEFFRRFPEGIYEIEGRTLDGNELESQVTVSHVMPAPARNVLVSGQSAAPNCDAENLPQVDEPVTLSWDPITQSHPDLGRDGPVDIVHYELVVEREEPVALKFTFQIPPDVTQVVLPQGLLNPGDEIKFEILAREESGNQTAIESCFDIAGGNGSGSGDSRSVLITPDKQADGNYGWLKLSDNTKQWVPDVCRSRLLAAGYPLEILSWNEISQFPDNNEYLECDALLAE